MTPIPAASVIPAAASVIPAQAGIQSKGKFPRSGTTGFRPLRGTIVLLDSRLRGNDGMQRGPR